MKGATTVYPIQTHTHACHHESPSWIIDEAIIHLCKPDCQLARDKGGGKLGIRVDIEAVRYPAEGCGISAILC